MVYILASAKIFNVRIGECYCISNELEMPVIVHSVRDGMNHNRYCLFCFRVYFHIQPTSHLTPNNPCSPPLFPIPDLSITQ